MLNRFFGSNTHTYLHILGVSGIAAGLPLNKVVMSALNLQQQDVWEEAELFLEYSNNDKNIHAYYILDKDSIEIDVTSNDPV